MNGPETARGNGLVQWLARPILGPFCIDAGLSIDPASLRTSSLRVVAGIALALCCVGLLATGQNCPAVEILWKKDFHLGIPDSSILQADITPDPGLELVLTTTIGKVIVCDVEGKILWCKGGYGVICNSPTPADLFPGGGSEILVENKQGIITCLSSEGDELWQYALPTGLDWNQTTIVATDLDRDGHLEIVAGDTNGFLVCLDRFGAEKWSYAIAGGFHSPPAAGDLDGDGFQEIVVTSGDGRLLALSHAGKLLWSADLGCDNISGPVIADLEGDGAYDILVGGNDAHLHCFSTAAPPVQSTDAGDKVDETDAGAARVLPGMTLKWQARLGTKGIDSTISVGDLNQDGKLEIVCLDLDGICVCLDPHGRELWRNNFGVRSRRAPSLADFNADGKIEILVSGYFPAFTLLSATGTKLETVPAAITNGGATVVDYHGRLAAIIPCDNGEIYCLTWQKEPVEPAAPVLWGSYRVDSGQTGLVAKVSGDLAPVTPAIGTEAARVTQRIEKQLQQVEKTSADLAALAQKLAAKDVEIDQLSRARLELFDLRRVARQFMQQVDNASEEQALMLARQIERALDQACKPRDSAVRILQLADGTKIPKLVAWTTNPWWHIRDVAEEFPQQLHSRKIKLFLYRNEVAAGAVNLLNLENRPLAIRIKAPARMGGETGPRVRLYEVLSVPTEKEDYADDALSGLGQARTIHIAPGETRQIFVSVRANKAAAGSHECEIVFAPVVFPMQPVSVHLQAEVVDLDIRDGTAPHLCTWGYVHSSALKDYPKKVWRDRIDHGNNVINVTGNFLPPAPYNESGELTAELDFDRLGEFIRQRPGGFFLLLSYPGVFRGPQGSAPFSTAHNRAVKAWITRLVDYLRTEGIGYDRFGMYPVDEPGLRPGLVDLYINYAKQIRAADPNVLMYTDPVDGADLEDIKRMAPWVDIWCPNRNGFLLKDNDPRLQVMKDNAKMMWTYECMHHAKHRPPLEYYRGQAWLAELRGLTGIGFWSYCTSADDPWEFPLQRSHDYLLVYPGRGVVTSRRWESVRDGVEDMRALAILKKLIAEKKGDDQAVATARKVVEEATEELGRLCTEPNGTGDSLESSVVATEWMTPKRADAEWNAYRRHRRRIAEATMALGGGH
jgi:glycosyl hydrolase family 123/putative pyrroloquinoline-quinone binding quinoprotein